MKNFNKGGRDGGRGGFRPGGDRGGFKSGFKKNYGNNRDERGEMTMHKAVCADCGKSCEVPFRPTNGKPVFCNECFGGKKGADRGDKRDFKRDDRPERSFTPSARAESPKENNDELMRHIKDLNIKIDNLIKLVDSMGMKKAEVKTEAKSEMKEEKVADKKPAAKKVVAVKKSVKPAAKKATGKK